MGSIRVHEFSTLDGIIDTPSWTAPYGFDPNMGATIASVMGGCEGLLLGRRTFEMFAPAWSARTPDQDPGAPFMNDSPKYVVASTPPSVDWNNSTVIGPYDPATIADLKGKVDGGLYVSGSATLVRALLADGLVDELHLFVYPLTLGTGLRLFPEGAPGNDLELISSDSYSNGVVHLGYRPKTA